MNAIKILWGQVLLVCLVVLASVWMATEWTAWRLGFQSQVGQPWFELSGWPVYRPTAFFPWRFSFDAYAPQVFGERDTSPPLAVSPRSPWPLPCQSCAPARPSGSRPMDRRGGPRSARLTKQAFSAMTACSSVAGAGATCVVTGRSMFLVSRRRAVAKALAWSFQRS